jgi:hypothetical protein
MVGSSPTWLLPLLCRLENGLHKLHKTQSEVDVLVENARAMAIEVEQKVANANVFAEQVMVSGSCSCAHTLTRLLM